MKPVFRVLPHHLEAELSVLNAAAHNREAARVVSELLRPEHFYDPAHGKIMAGMNRLLARGEAVDYPSLDEELRGQVSDAQLLSLTDASYDFQNVRAFCESILEKALLRATISAAQDIMARASTEGAGAREALDYALTRISGVGINEQGRGWRDVAHGVSDYLGRLGKLEEREGYGLRGIRTGFHALDSLLQGMARGNLWVVAARPGVGKSALACDFMRNISMQGEDSPVSAIFSLEMGFDEISERIAHAASGVVQSEGRVHARSHEDIQRISDCFTEGLSNARIWVDDHTRSLEAICSRARRLRAKTPNLALLVVDYLQLVKTGRRTNESRQEEVSEISRTLKLLARELEVPIVACAQLNRQVEARNGKPMLGDLKDSGAIEADADAVLLLWRPAQAGRSQEFSESDTCIDVAKNRHGPTGRVLLTFNASVCRFENRF